MIETELLKGILVFIIGGLLGSFLNVVIYRLPREKSIVFPGSKCPKCNNEIAWYDNIPILSWLLLKAKCRYCSEPISMRYPLVEFLTASLLYSTYLSLGINFNWLFLSYFVCLLVVISMIDLDHLVILDSLTYPAILVGFIYGYINSFLTNSILASLGGMLFFYIMSKASFFILKKDGMGEGDATFAAVLGAWLGTNNLIGSLMISFFIGSIIGIILLLYKGKSEVFPFGPSLAIGALVTMLTKNYILDLYLNNFVYLEIR